MCCVWAGRGRQCLEEGEGLRRRRKQQEARVSGCEVDLHRLQEVQDARAHACAQGSPSLRYALVCVCVCAWLDFCDLCLLIGTLQAATPVCAASAGSPSSLRQTWRGRMAMTMRMTRRRRGVLDLLASELRAAYIGLRWAVHARGGGGCVFRVCSGGDVVCRACARARGA